MSVLDKNWPLRNQLLNILLFQLCHILMDCGISNNMKKKKILKNYNWIPISNKNSSKNSSKITDEKAWKDEEMVMEK